MVFSELSFLYIFLPICLIIHLSLKNTAAKNAVLLVMSLLFYAWGEPVWVLLMAAVSMAAWGFGLWIEGSRRPKAAVTVSVLVTLLPLIFFKYRGFIAGNLGFGELWPKIALPIGISFYTFQIVSYLADVYWKKTPAQKNPFYFMLYVSLFPQLIAGPIVRYVDVAAQINRRSVTAEGFSCGVLRFVTGLGKKVILANTAGSVVSGVLSEPMSELGTAGAWGVMLCYAFQIYFDFSGYSDMAIGMGKMLGFDYGENFNYPYTAHSVTDFWRRWHISMSSFFRDYIYIPLGGNRRRQIFNMLVVWAATGLWHGAGWNYVCWGLYFFVLLVIEKYLLKNIKLPKAVGIPVTFVLVLFGWVFFYFENMGQGFEMLKIMFGLGGGSDAIALPQVVAALPVLIVCAVCSTPLLIKLKNKAFALAPPWAITVMESAYVLAMLFVCTSLVVSSTYNPFLYFRF